MESEQHIKMGLTRRDRRWTCLSWQEIWAGGLFFLQLVATTTPAQDAEFNANTVKVSVYMMSVSQWASVNSTFNSILVAQANSYCSEDPSRCGLSTWDTNREFSVSHITWKGSPVSEKPYLNFSMALALPAGVTPEASANQYYLKKSALEAVAGASRSPLKQSAGADIAVVEQTTYGPLPDPVLNGVLSAVFALIVLILFIIVLVLRKKCVDDYTHLIKPKAELDKEPEAPAERGPSTEPSTMDPYKTGYLTPVESLPPEPVLPTSVVEPTKTDDFQNGNTGAVNAVNGDSC